MKTATTQPVHRRPRGLLAIAAITVLLAGCSSSSTPAEKSTDAPSKADAESASKSAGTSEWAGSIGASSNSGLFLGTGTGGYQPKNLSLACSQEGDDLTATFTSPAGTFTTTRPGAPNGQRQVAGGTYKGNDGTTITWTVVDGATPTSNQVQDGPKRSFEGDGQWGSPVAWEVDGTSITIRTMSALDSSGKEVKVRIKDASCAGGAETD